MDEKDGELLPYDVLVEILSRIPAKPLMRFKCVSKRWISIITDPVFAELHNTRSYTRQGGGGGGVFVTPTLSTDQCLMCIIDMKKQPLERVSVLEPDIPYDNNRTTNIVNGLICFYHNSYEKRCIYLYNLSTRESISLPSTQVDDSLKQSYDFSPVCKYIFDLTTSERLKAFHFLPIKSKIVPGFILTDFQGHAS